ncbi:GNAT family N-acetyltransferase [Aquimarina brevivitae]|uniref:Diamine N-acetyltransferase n=1 Tax=Aquimarina brevivitae TaxID=323412 RepID=A0A4Q7NYU1_9FLAO|nr:GNAT family protein [Aquimarina brevivitae]RZS92631.1 diamine N-acetyltransferase [Aquimarina brevivitae]
MVSLKGKTVYLRALEYEDLDFLYKVENNESIWEISSTLTPYSKFILKQYLEQSHRDIYEVKQLRLAICSQKDELIGFVDFYDFDPSHQRVGVGVLIADEKNRAKGYGAEVLKMVTTYCFNHLGLHQIYATITEDNVASIRLFENQGFVKTGVKKDWIKSGKAFKNELLYQLINVH